MFNIKLKDKIISISHEIIVILIMLIFAAAYFIQTKNLSFQSLLFPRLLFVGIGITGILSIKGCIKTRNSGQPDRGAKAEDSDDARGISMKLAVFVASVFALIFCFPYFGANLSIVLFVLSGMLILGVRSKLILLLAPLATTIFIFCIFRLWLEVPLPVCFLGF